MHIKSKFFPLLWACILFWGPANAWIDTWDDEDILFDTDTFFEDATEADAYIDTDILRNVTLEDIFPSIAEIARDDNELRNLVNKISNLLIIGAYKKSHPITERNVLDLPSIGYVTPSEEPTCITYARPFYNHTDAAAFDGKKTTIAAVTNLSNESLIQALEELINFSADDLPGIAGDQLSEEQKNALRRLNTFDIPTTLPLFAQIQMQGRRAGILFDHTIAHDTWSLTVQFPFYYVEHNFFVTPQTMKQLNRSRLITETSTQPADCDDTATENFLKEHLVADRLGVGDTRLTWTYACAKNPPLSAWVGLDATFPTAGSFSEGLLGGEFTDFPDQPVGILETLINASSEGSQDATTIGTDFALNILDRITRIFIDRPLGQKHFGIAPIFYAYWDAASCDITAKARIEYLTPRTETRFFIVPTTREQLNNPDYTDPDTVDENIAFLEKKITDAILPTPLDAHVKQGLSPQITTTIGQTYSTWRWYIGFDFWYYQREHIEIPETVRSQTLIDIASAERPRAYQTKLFGDISMEAHTNHYVWDVGITMDGTIAYSDIGQDFTFGIYAGTSW